MALIKKKYLQLKRLSAGDPPAPAGGLFRAPEEGVNYHVDYRGSSGIPYASWLTYFTKRDISKSANLALQFDGGRLSLGRLERSELPAKTAEASGRHAPIPKRPLKKRHYLNEVRTSPSSSAKSGTAQIMPA